MWRSWLARQYGVLEAVGSSPATPTNSDIESFRKKVRARFARPTAGGIEPNPTNAKMKTMDHVAIMKKRWGLLPKILEGKKTVESRWHKSKTAPWNKIKTRDTIYFKNSGEKVITKAIISKVEQLEIHNNKQALKIMNRYSKQDLGTTGISNIVKEYISNKNYAIFVHFNNVELVNPFAIDKSGFGMQSAWLTVENIDRVKV